MPSENEEFEFRARAEKEAGSTSSRKLPLSVIGKMMWEVAPQNPRNQLKNLPMTLGAIGGASPIPGGMTMGTGIGQGLRYAGNRIFNQPQPGKLQLGMELGGSALGDVAAVPAIKKSILGKIIGERETEAGVPSAENIPSLPKPKAGDPVSGGIDSAVESVKEGLKNGGTPTFWKQIKDQIDSFYELGKDAKMTDLDSKKLRWLSKAVQTGLNRSVPGREFPAQALARSQTIPRVIETGYRAIPKSVKYGLGVGGGVTAPIGFYEIIKRLLGG